MFPDVTPGGIQKLKFEPIEYGQSYTVIITNTKDATGEVMAFHHGRGSQEGLFAELKSQNQLAYVPSKYWNTNRAYLLAVMFAHNLKPGIADDR